MELICVFLRGRRALQDGGYTTAQDFQSRYAYSRFIGASNRKTAEGQGEGATERRESTNIIRRRKEVL